MSVFEQIAEAALSGDAISARSLLQDWLRTNVAIGDIPRPRCEVDPTLAALTAALLELFALRSGQEPPSWTSEFVRESEPIYLLKAASRLRRLREMCNAETPLPLRRRNFYAPANYLTAV